MIAEFGGWSQNNALPLCEEIKFGLEEIARAIVSDIWAPSNK